MKVKYHFISCFIILLLAFNSIQAQQINPSLSIMEKDFVHPPNSAKPWVFWYWMHGNVSKEGITADLEAMKKVGLGGAYLMFIQDTVINPFYNNNARQLTESWSQMVSFAIYEAKRIGLELGIHISDGFALAGGPWITPELSMQKLVWSTTRFSSNGNEQNSIELTTPSSFEHYYKDVAIYAFPTPQNASFSTRSIHPVITTSTNEDAQFLIEPTSKKNVKMTSNGFIQYYFEQPFTCHQILIKTNGNNYQSHRMIIQASDDGKSFTTITRLIPPRHGWQDTDEPVTHSIPLTTAHYFRFVYDKEGTEPGSEDLDNAKWSPVLKVSTIELNGSPVLNQFESKNGSVWRVSNGTLANQVANEECIPFNRLINISSHVQNGHLQWKAPSGEWTVLRIGHTSTGHTNETGGGGRGLEVDKFNPDAVNIQLDQWFNKIYHLVDSETAKKVIQLIHIDSWECGSQNWTTHFAEEFKKRRGYDLMPYLPVVSGLPIESVQKSELVLLDIRKTIAELVSDAFFGTIQQYASKKKLKMTAESVAPTMTSDGMLHYAKVDIPMGEFWNNSPTHDKPNDMLDAISAGHVYGKNIIQAEAFTTLRMDWNEHPGNLKSLGDRNFALGINKMVLHVFTHNPSMEKKPGMTLDGVGLYFQRDQTWFNQSKSWIDYLSRCQYLLQQGKPVVDIAVFTGDELPSRAILPDRLVTTLPGIFGSKIVTAEKTRLFNTGQPQRQIPDGVGHAAQMADPENWVNCLNGYQYDALNPDALLNLTKVNNGIIELNGGARYKLLIIPGDLKLNPNNTIRKETIIKIITLAKQGAKIILSPEYIPSFKSNGLEVEANKINKVGNGMIYIAPFMESSFNSLELSKDVQIENDTIDRSSIAYAHRKTNSNDIYFISNQKPYSLHSTLSFNVQGLQPEIWDPLNGSRSIPLKWKMENGRTWVQMTLDANASQMIVFTQKSNLKTQKVAILKHEVQFNKKWELQFESPNKMEITSIALDSLYDLSNANNASIKYFAGTIHYKNQFNVTKSNNVKIELGKVANIATVLINGKNCGTVWTAPYTLDISKAVQKGNNTIEILVANTWHNRLIGDHLNPNDKSTYTTAPYRLKDKLTPTGLLNNPIIYYNF